MDCPRQAIFSRESLGAGQRGVRAASNGLPESVVACSRKGSAERQTVIPDLGVSVKIESSIRYFRKRASCRSSAACARMRSLRGAKRSETRRATDAAPIRKRLVARSTVKGMQASGVNPWIRRFAPSCARRGRTLMACKMSGCDECHKTKEIHVEKMQLAGTDQCCLTAISYRRD